MITLAVPFEEKNQFKETCRSLNIVYSWKHRDIWEIDSESLPPEFSKWIRTEKHRISVLTCSYNEQKQVTSQGAKWLRKDNIHTYTGPLPPKLLPYLRKPFSFEAAKERELNEEPEIHYAPKHAPVLEPHHLQAVEKILAAYVARAPGFLLGDAPGIEKTLPAWKAVLAISQLKQTPLSVLIVATPAAIETWRETLLSFGNGNISGKPNEAILIEYPQMARFFDQPNKGAKTTRGAAKFAHPKPFDIIIFDHARTLKSPQSAHAKLARKLSEAATFTLYLSSTFHTNPLELHYLSNVLAFRTKTDPTSVIKQFDTYLQALNFQIRKGNYGRPLWTPTTPDLERLHNLLFSTPSIGLKRTPKDLPNYPPIQRIRVPFALGAHESIFHLAHWSAYSATIPPNHSFSSDQLHQISQFRSALSHLRARHTCALAQDLIDNHFQLSILVDDFDSLDRIKNQLQALLISTVEFSTRNPSERTANLNRYSRGQASVLLYTHLSVLSDPATLLCHLTPEKAANSPKAQIVHDLSTDFQHQKTTEQAHHMPALYPNSLIYYPYFSNTLEQNLLSHYLHTLTSPQRSPTDPLQSLFSHPNEVPALPTLF